MTNDKALTPYPSPKWGEGGIGLWTNDKGQMTKDK